MNGRVEAPVRVIGVGSAQGDDRLGWEVIGALQADRDLRRRCGDRLALMCAASPAAVVERLAGCRHALVVDAVRSGAPAGTLHCLAAERLAAGVSTLSSHGIDLAAALALVCALEPGMEGVTVYGIEAGDDGSGLSPAVTRSFDPLVARLRRAILALCDHGG